MNDSPSTTRLERLPQRAPVPSPGLNGQLEADYVAFLIDYPLLLRMVRASEPNGAPALAPMVQRACSFGRLLTARAYGAWYDADEATAAFTAGIEPVFVPPAGGGLVPSATALVADGLALLRGGRVSILVLSGDDRLFPLVAAARAQRTSVRLLAHACLDRGPCIPLADGVEPVSAFVRTPTRAEKYRRGSGASAQRSA